MWFYASKGPVFCHKRFAEIYWWFCAKSRHSIEIKGWYCFIMPVQSPLYGYYHCCQSSTHKSVGNPHKGEATALKHYCDDIMDAMASQITSLTNVYSTVYSDADQRKHQSSASLASVRGIHRGPVNSPHKGPVRRKMFPFDDVTMMSHFSGHPTVYSKLFRANNTETTKALDHWRLYWGSTDSRWIPRTKDQ